MGRIIAYLRTSTDKQDLEAQKTGIEALAIERGWTLEYYEESVSGSVSYKDRGLGNLIDELYAGDILIVSELSRLGRSMIDALTLINHLVERGIKLIAIKGGYEINGSIQSKIITTVLCMAAEIERDLIRQRTKEALAKKKARGEHLGRPFGTFKFRDKTKEIKAKHHAGTPISKLAREYDTSWQAISNVVKGG